VASTPLSSEDLRPFKNLAVPASPKNSARTLTPGPVRPAVAKVNLNTASQAELESLPRVGPAMAKRIIQGRPYRNLEDLDKVKGVGPKMLEVLAPLVSF
jgi:competence protein ComEA